MSGKRKTVAVLCVGFVSAVVYFYNTNPVISNLVYVFSYEKTLDAYSHTDTTNTTLTSRIDAAGRQAKILSAFFGLDDDMPNLASWVICEGADGKDGMPVVFSHEVDVSTIEPGDFRITRESGDIGEVTCLTMAPADGEGELRTALLIGQYGSLEDQPVTVEIVGNILSSDRSANFLGSSIKAVRLEDGPRIVWGEVVPEEAWKLGQEATSIPWGGGDGCPAQTKQIVLVTWDGGITKPGGQHADDHERKLYRVEVMQPDGTTRQVTPIALADLGDGDNNHKLCLDVAAPAISASFPAGYVTDPREDINATTSISLTQTTKD